MTDGEELEKEANDYADEHAFRVPYDGSNKFYDDVDFKASKEGYLAGAEFGYNKANESHSPDEHIDKDKVVLGIIKHCNKTRYSLVQWNGEWWYQYGTFNAEIRLIAWYNIPELPKESE